MLLVCSVCGAKMTCPETGVFIRRGTVIREGDLYECGCGSRVIADFGQAIAEKDAPQLYARVTAALDTGLPYVSRRVLQERF